jgi:hypothetical protein
MSPKHHHMPLSGGDRKAFTKELSKSRAMTRIFAERSAEKRREGEALIREADNLSCQSWNERQQTHADHLGAQVQRLLLDLGDRGLRHRVDGCLGKPPPATVRDLAESCPGITEIAVRELPKSVSGNCRNTQFVVNFTPSPHFVVANDRYTGGGCRLTLPEIPR